MIHKTKETDTHMHKGRHLLRGAELRATPGRMALVDLLMKEKDPLSAVEIEKRLKNILDRASVYRALEALEKAGAIVRVDLGQAHAFYELSSGRTHHHHVICSKCGDMEDVEAGTNCPAKKVEHQALTRSEKFGHISRHSLEFFGLCRKCEVAMYI